MPKRTIATAPGRAPVNATAAPDLRVVKALSHPVRFRALTILNRRVSSPRELANELNESLGVVSYHVKMLVEAGALELVNTAQRRGAVEHYYRATVRPFLTGEEYARLPIKTRRTLFIPTVTRIIKDAMTALEQGGFDDPTNQSRRITLDLDKTGYDRLVALINSNVLELTDIQARSINGLAASQVEPYARIQVGLIHHRRPSTG